MSKKTKNLTDPEEIKSIVEKGDISNIQHKPYLQQKTISKGFNYYLQKFLIIILVLVIIMFFLGSSKTDQTILAEKQLPSQPQPQQQIQPPKEQILCLGQKCQNHRKRSQYFTQKSKMERYQYLRLAKYNLQDPLTNQEKKNAFQQQRQILQKKYNMNQYEQQLSICAVIYASTHKKAYSHQYIINSIFNQAYSSYIIIYIADGFDAAQIMPVKQYIKKKNGNTNKIQLIWNFQKKYFLESTKNAIKDYCMSKRITALLDGDDQLMGAQVFRLINTYYHRYNLNMAYGNFIQYHQAEHILRIGFGQQYSDSQKNDNIYRTAGQKFASLKTFRTRLISFIRQNDFKDRGGNYYKFAGDYALMYPLLELSCGQIKYIPEFNYLYYGYEVDPTYGSMQILNGRAIRSKSRYECFKQYK